MASYYAVHRGRTPGVYASWTEVQPLVSGFPNACFKKFATQQEAEQFAETGAVVASDDSTTIIETLDDDVIFIYTDGAYSSKTRRCGVGVAFDAPYSHLAITKRLPDGSSNQHAELDGLLSALFTISVNVELQQTPVVVWTDSDYGIKCLLQYVNGWRKNGWRTAQGQPVKHQRLIDDARTLMDQFGARVTLRHIKEVGLTSHASRASVAGASQIVRRVWDGNRRADELARGR